MALKTFTAGEFLYAADVNEYLVNSKFARKTADESVTSSTTLQDDNDLVIPVLGDRTFEVQGLLIADAGSATPDLKLQFSAPAGASLGLGLLFERETTAIDLTTVQVLQLSATAIAVMLRGVLTVGVTAGDFKLRWAQNTSSATASTVRAGSFLWLQRVA